MRVVTALVTLSLATAAFGQGIERIHPDGMTKPETYRHVVKVGNLLFIAGQVSLDPDGNLVGENDMKAQVRRVLENLKIALASQGADYSNVVKINIFTTSIDAFREAADVRAEYFAGHPPASTLVQIDRLARPEFLVEIEAIAALKE
jgi:reactive intermediate/imine deaminase